MDGDWRAPNEYEKELIIKWERCTRREDVRQISRLLLILFISGVITFVVLVFAMPEFWSGFVKVLTEEPEIFPTLAIFLSLTIFLFIQDLRFRIKLKRGDYQILITVVAGRLQTDQYLNLLTLSTPSGENIEISVSKATFKVAKQDTPGFVLRFKVIDPSKKQGILKKIGDPLSGYHFAYGMRMDEKE